MTEVNVAVGPRGQSTIVAAAYQHLLKEVGRDTESIPFLLMDMDVHQIISRMAASDVSNLDLDIIY